MFFYIFCAALGFVLIRGLTPAKKDETEAVEKTKQITGTVELCENDTVKVNGKRGQLELRFGPKIRIVDGKKYTIHYNDQGEIVRLLSPRKK